MGAISTFTLRGIVWRAIVKTRIVFLLFVYYSSHSKSCHPIRALIESHHYSQVCDVSGRTMRVCHISIQAAFFFYLLIARDGSLHHCVCKNRHEHRYNWTIYFATSFSDGNKLK